MEWSKLKNIIILILLGLNLSLLFLVFLREEKTSQYAKEMLENSVSVLEDLNGISLNCELPDDDKTLSLCTISRDLEKELAFVTSLLGSDTTAEDYGGGLYLYTSANGTAQFRSNFEFSCTISVPQEATSDPSGDACRYFSSCGLQAELLSSETSGDVTIVTVLQYWNDVPLFSQNTTFTYTNHQLTSVSGYVFTSDPVASTNGGTALDTATLLIRFLGGLTSFGDVCSEITSITPAYLLPSSLSESLTPVWYIKTDTGSYYLDMLTGSLIRL